MAFYIYDPKRVEFSNQNTVTISHNFGRRVNIEVSVVDPLAPTQYTVCLPKITHNSNNNISTVQFYENGSLSNKTGFVVVN